MKKTLLVACLSFFFLAGPIDAGQRFYFRQGGSYFPAHRSLHHGGYGSRFYRPYRSYRPYGYAYFQRPAYGYYSPASYYRYSPAPYYYGYSGYSPYSAYGYATYPYDRYRVAPRYYPEEFYYGRVGSYSLNLSTTRYVSDEEAVDSGSPVVRANYADLIFNVQPDHALVFIDGKLIGSARSFATERDRYTIIDGEHQLRIFLPGYQAFEATLEVMPDRTLHIDVELEPEQP